MNQNFNAYSLIIQHMSMFPNPRIFNYTTITHLYIYLNFPSIPSYLNDTRPNLPKLIKYLNLGTFMVFRLGLLMCSFQEQREFIIGSKLVSNGR